MIDKIRIKHSFWKLKTRVLSDERKYIYVYDGDGDFCCRVIKYGESEHAFNIGDFEFFENKFNKFLSYEEASLIGKIKRWVSYHF